VVTERAVVRPEVCVGAVVVHDERLLLVRRGRGAGRGLWSVPGGRVEPAERLEAAAMREVAEETGLRVVIERWIGWVERIGPGYHFVIHDFAASLAPGVEPDDAVSGDDAADVRWQPLHTLPGSSDLVPGLVEFLVEHGVVPAQ
jgi:ADP-ribose pyrophosphatase YjhB (NUDIX family)